MKDIIQKHSFYAVWEYEKEEQDLNEASRNGLQLVRGGCYKSMFRQDNSVRYIYQIDYNPKIADPVQYRNLFEEQGWEYINSTFNGWHYFRKLFDEETPESEYKIYTDKQSLEQMQNRWVRLISIFVPVCAVLSVLYMFVGIHQGSTAIIIESAVFILMTVTLALGLLNAMRCRKGKENGFTLPFRVTMPVIIAGLLVALCFLVYQDIGIVVHHENFTYKELKIGGSPFTCGDYSVGKSGVYRLDLEADAGGGVMTVQIISENGQEIFGLTTTDCSISGQKIPLEEGVKYQTLYTCDIANQDKVRADLVIKKVS